MLDLELLLSLPNVDPYGSLDIAPERGWLAFAWNKTGQWEIWIADLKGENPLKQITHGPGGKFSPRFSPDGKLLAYVLDLDGGENYDIWVTDLQEGQHINLTPDTPEAIQPNLSWSPDSCQIALISDRDGQFNPYILTLADGDLRPAASLPFPAWDVRWSPAGNHLTVVVEGSAQDYFTYLVPLTGTEPTPLSKDSVPGPASEAAWSPDGKRLAFSSISQGNKNIAVYDLKNENVAWLTSGSGDKESPAWSSDGQKLVYVHNQAEINWLVVRQLADASEKPYRVGNGTHYLPGFTPDGYGVACVFENAAQPEDLWLISLAGEPSRQLTHSLPKELHQAGFIHPEVVQYPGMDQASVPALLFRPTDRSSPAPAVIVIHGGPNWLFQLTWMPIVQHMVSRGWVVLAPNYRGSTGYGQAWQIANRFDLGGGDADDVAAGAVYLAAQGLADPSRIAVTGRSHGGYLTMCCLTRYPQLWAAGSAVVPFLNWFTAHENSRQDLQHWDLENFGNPVQDYERWYARSPYFFLDRIQVPVQLICGANDPRCPASESTAARDALIAQGKTVDFVQYPDEGHTFLKIENLIDAEKRRVDFLAQHLEKGSC